MESNASKVLLNLIKIQLLDMQFNLKEREQWIKENNPRLMQWNNKEISQNYSTIKGCLDRILK